MSGVPTPLNWISCIVPSLPCHAYHLEHAGSSAVVVRIASDVCSSFCFFPDRITKWCCEIRRDLRQVLLQLFTGEPTSFTYFTVSVSLIYCYPYVTILLCHVSYSTCYPYIRDTPPRPTFCLLLPALRVVGEFRVLLLLSRNVRDNLLGC